MANKRSLTGTYQKVLSGQGTIAFRDFEAPFPVQPDGKETKRYQVRQLRDMMRKYGIGFGPDG